MRILLMSLVFALGVQAKAERIVYDFETGDLQGWKVTSGAFERIVTDRAKEHNTGNPYTKGGKYFVSTLEDKHNRSADRQTGVVESPTIRLTGPTITFKIGGGEHARFELVDRATGKAIVSATGENGEPMRTVTWNVPKFVGKDVYFRIVDHATCGWGHVTIDDVSFEGIVPPPCASWARSSRRIPPRSFWRSCLPPPRNPQRRLTHFS